MRQIVNCKVTINDITWTIQSESIDSDAIGLTNYRQQLITMEEDVGMDVFIATLKHELTHAIIYSYGLDQFPKFNQEMLCDFMATHAGELMDLTATILSDDNTQLTDEEEIDVEFEEE